jgi:hypothetical protein
MADARTSRLTAAPPSEQGLHPADSCEVPPLVRVYVTGAGQFQLSPVQRFLQLSPVRWAVHSVLALAGMTLGTVLGWYLPLLLFSTARAGLGWLLAVLFVQFSGAALGLLLGLILGCQFAEEWLPPRQPRFRPDRD